MTKFQVGKTYYQASLCDHECIFRFKILARTAKTITTIVHDKRVKRGIGVDEYGIEHFMPFGRYSMAPSVGADRAEG